MTGTGSGTADVGTGPARRARRRAARRVERSRARLAPLAALLAGLALTGCGPEEAVPDAEAAPAPASAAAGHGDHAAMQHQGLDADEPSGFSIYHAESVWTDQAGEQRRLESLRGRPQVVAMVYTSCAVACPRILMDMKRIEGELAPERRDDVGFVLVTIDPERDTPERLAGYARGSRLDPDRWTLLTADEGDILELAALLGVQYRQTAPGEWVHSNMISVLDADGAVVHRQMGLGTDPSATLDVLRRLAG